jgi:hypothetical protein
LKGWDEMAKVYVMCRIEKHTVEYTVIADSIEDANEKIDENKFQKRNCLEDTLDICDEWVRSIRDQE